MPAVDKRAALEVIEAEGLQGAVWFEKPTNRIGAVAIYTDEGKWVVSATDERAVEESKELFDSESKALESFLERLRAWNGYLEWSRAHP